MRGVGEREEASTDASTRGGLGSDSRDRVVKERSGLLRWSSISTLRSSAAHSSGDIWRDGDKRAEGTQEGLTDGRGGLGREVWRAMARRERWK